MDTSEQEKEHLLSLYIVRVSDMLSDLVLYVNIVLFSGVAVLGFRWPGEARL